MRRLGDRPFGTAIVRLAGVVYASGPIKIVAIGSSTTAGEGGVVAYPYRLEEALRATYQGRMVDVLNRGKGGDEARTELARLETDVLREKPALVIWQVGTNAVWKDDEFGRHGGSNTRRSGTAARQGHGH